MTKLLKVTIKSDTSNTSDLVPSVTIIKPFLNVMVDLETLSTKSNAKIIALAAVTFFDTDAYIKYFYEKCLPVIELGFDIESKTIEWWNKQDEVVRDEAFSGTQLLYTLLINFTAWCKATHCNIILWGNGSDFDNVVLRNAYNAFNLEPPWSYRFNRCYRTLKAIAPKEVQLNPFINPAAHNALEDAKCQAKHADLILSYMDTLRIK